jgi:hypothetical protein
MATEVTEHVVKAARHRPHWGRYATLQYLKKRAIDIRLYQIAIVLEFESKLMKELK